MGQAGTFVCVPCGHRFESMQGGGMRTEMFRCEKCDASRLVGRDEPGSYFEYKVGGGETKSSGQRNESCGGTMRTDLRLCARNAAGVKQNWRATGR